MKRFNYNRFFPAPRFLRMSAVGLDISDTTLRIAELVPRNKELELARFGSEPVPKGVITSGKITDPEKFKDILTRLKKRFNLSYIRASLPEEQIYLFRISLPKSRGTSIRSSIELQLEEHIPIPAVDVVFDYELFSETDSLYEFQVCCIPNGIVFDYLMILKDVGLTPVGFELEAQAITRALISKHESGTMLVIDFGDTRTGISIVSNGVVLYSSTIDFGGRALTESLQKNFSISFEEAEKMKRIYGLQRNMGREELFPVLLNELSILRDEINKTRLYWEGHSDSSDNVIEKVILAGGDSNLIGLPDYLSTSLRIPVEVGSVWSNINSLSHYIPPVSQEESLSYATALGLALGDFEHD